MIMYGSLKFEPFWGRLVIKLSHLLLGMSSAVNILIYSYKVLLGGSINIFRLFSNAQDFKFRSVLLTGCRACPSQHHRFITCKRAGMVTWINGCDWVEKVQTGSLVITKKRGNIHRN